VLCRNESGLLRRESKWCRKEKTEMNNNNVCLQCEKKGDLGWQSKETSPKTRAYPIGSPAKETHPNKHVCPVRNYQFQTLYPVTNTTAISNRLKQPVTDRALIGSGLYKPVTDRFNICNGLSLTSVTKNSCNGCLRSSLPDPHW
jgi:hypothetical protein